MNLNPLKDFMDGWTESQEDLKKRKQIFKSFKAKADVKRSESEKLADSMTAYFGSMRFLLLNLIWFAAWILINTNSIPGVKAFDPYPFNFLTMVVSLEAIVLATFVLISQNRAARIDDLREELDLQINLISEREVTKVIKLLSLLLERQGIDLSQDPELKKMLRPTSASEIEKHLEKEIK
ncbi:MAG: DUF1003 domain-containing protein [Candidatus Doudnabacteria bacterium]|nr:DUF1003 domain-containing protein [Candidatus Doudnabacteria bacterium]